MYSALNKLKLLLGLNKPKIYTDYWQGSCSPDCPCKDQVPLRVPATKKETASARIYAYLNRLGPVGATVEEISEHLSINQNTVRPRIKELENLGAVTFYKSIDGETATGHPARLYVTAENYAQTALI